MINVSGKPVDPTEAPTDPPPPKKPPQPELRWRLMSNGRIVKEGTVEGVAAIGAAALLGGN